MCKRERERHAGCIAADLVIQEEAKQLVLQWTHQFLCFLSRFFRNRSMCMLCHCVRDACLEYDSMQEKLHFANILIRNNYVYLIC
jgi:hypothetical protein